MVGNSALEDNQRQEEDDEHNKANECEDFGTDVQLSAVFGPGYSGICKRGDRHTINNYPGHHGAQVPFMHRSRPPFPRPENLLVLRSSCS